MIAKTNFTLGPIENSFFLLHLKWFTFSHCCYQEKWIFPRYNAKLILTLFSIANSANVVHIDWKWYWWVLPVTIGYFFGFLVIFGVFSAFFAILGSFWQFLLISGWFLLVSCWLLVTVDTLWWLLAVFIVYCWSRNKD